MTINSLNGVSSVQRSAAVERSAQTVRIHENDSVAVSSEAKTMGEVYAVAEDLQNIPDIRTDLVEEVRARLEASGYLNDRTAIDNVAEKMLGLFIS